MDKFLNILRIIGAFILSTILVGILMCSSIIYSLSAFIQKDAIVEVMKNVDIVEILKTDESFESELNANRLTSNMLSDFFNSKAIDEMIEVYIDDFFNVLDGENNVSFTKDKIINIANENMNELIPIVKEMILSQDESIQMSDEQLEEIVLQLFADLKESIPNVIELGIIGENATQETKEMIQMIQFLRNGVIVIPFVIIAFVLSLLIYICRWNKCEGFIWLGVDYIFPCGAVLAFSNSFKTIRELISTDIPKEFEEVIISSLNVFASKLSISALVLGVCAFVFIGIYIIFFNLRRKRISELEVTM